MKVRLSNQVSSVQVDLYEFEISINGSAYVGHFTSFRSKERTWGHLWRDVYNAEIVEIKNQRRELENEEDFESEEYSKLKHAFEQYNPCLQKTEDGKPFYSGTFSTKGNLPPVPWNKAETKWRILVEIEKLL